MRYLSFLFVLGLVACVQQASQLPEDWRFERCPDRDATAGCDLEFPGQKNWAVFEAQNGNAFMSIGREENFVIRIDDFSVRQFSATEIAQCKEYKIKIDCTRYLRFEDQKGELRIVGLGFKSSESEFLYYVFSPKNTYFINGTAKDKNPDLLDLSIRNVRLVSSRSPSAN